MSSNVSPIRPNPREESVRSSDRTRPQNPPKNDNFRKTMKDRSDSKDEGEASAVEDHEEAPSLFDLSKSKKSKSASTLSKRSSVKDSASDLTPNRPVTAKEGRDQGEAQEQESSLFASKEGQETTTDMPQESMNDQLLAAGDEQPAVEESFQETETPPPPLPGETKKPVDQSQSLDALKRQAAAAALNHPQKVKGEKEDSSFERSTLGRTSKKEKSGKGEAARGEKSEARGEIAGGVNASIQSAGFQTEKAQESKEATQSATIKELATQIVDRIQVMRKDNETQTTITLKQPPVLAGATITLTASDNAKREFNISFANLSPDAKLLLDRKLNEDSLTQTLERKGIVVHVLTTSTQPESAIVVDAGQASRDRQDQQQQQQEQQQRRQNFQSAEEEEVT